MARKPIKADPFEVWGQPPGVLTKGLSKEQLTALRRYTDMVSDKCYRIAYDRGLMHGLRLVGETASAEWNRRIRKRR